MIEKYLSEAFQSLKSLNEDIIDLKDSSLEDKVTEIQNSIEDEQIPVIDNNAADESELEDSYVGKVIIECEVCHSKIYKDAEEIVCSEECDDDDSIVNVEEECPFCYSTDGYKIVGQVAPYQPEQVDVEISPVADDAEGASEEELTEAKNKHCCKKDHLKESNSQGVTVSDLEGVISQLEEIIEEMYDRGMQTLPLEPNTYGLYGTFISFPSEGYLSIDSPFGEDEEDSDYEEGYTRKNVIESAHIKPWNGNYKGYKIRLDTDTKSYCIYDKHNELEDSGFISKEDAKKAIDKLVDTESNSIQENKDLINKSSFKHLCVNPVEEKVCNSEIKENFSKLDIETDSEKIKISSSPIEEEGSQEVLAPLTPEKEAEIKQAEEVVEPTLDETPSEDEFEDVDVDELEEESFNSLSEKYFKERYKGAKSFKTTSVKECKNKLVIEGILEYKSGRKLNTQFEFTPKDYCKDGRCSFEGRDTNLSESVHFELLGRVNGNKLITECFKRI